MTVVGPLGDAGEAGIPSFEDDQRQKSMMTTPPHASREARSSVERKVALPALKILGGGRCGGGRGATTAPLLSER
jgi:hypothetical protein